MVVKGKHDAEGCLTKLEFEVSKEHSQSSMLKAGHEPTFALLLLLLLQWEFGDADLRSMHACVRLTAQHRTAPHSTALTALCPHLDLCPDLHRCGPTP